MIRDEATDGLFGVAHIQQVREFFDQLSRRFAKAVYRGEWFSPLMSDLLAVVSNVSRYATGAVTFGLYKGNVMFIRANGGPHTLYSSERSSMEIEKNQGIHIDAYVNPVHDKNKATTPDHKPDKTEARADTVVISDAAKRIQEATRQLEEIPDVREDKVAQLKAQVENGTYEINAEKIADKMINGTEFHALFKA